MTPQPRCTLGDVSDLTRCPHCGRSLRYLTVPEAASSLGVTSQTIRRRIHDGTLSDVVKEQIAGGHHGTRFLIPVREVNRLRRASARS